MGLEGARKDLENVIINVDYIIHTHLLHMLMIRQTGFQTKHFRVNSSITYVGYIANIM